MTDLFPNTESKSPRLLWMERHGIEVYRRAKPIIPGMGEWIADGPHDIYGDGESEDEALFNYAKANKLKLWNEE